MTGRDVLLWVVCLGLSGQVLGVAPKCELRTIAELPVTMNGPLPIVPAKINGTDVRLILDSGAFWSLITPATALELKLGLTAAPGNLRLLGVGGAADVSITRVEDFRLARYALRRVEFIVGGNDPGGGAAGYVGQNLLRLADVEYDLGNGVIRLQRPDGCRDAVLAYWARGVPVSSLELFAITPLEPHTSGEAYLNGRRIRVMFDTGAATSFITRSAAQRAGVRLDSAEVRFVGESIGVGQRAVRTWVGPFESFKLGDEEIRHTELRIGDTDLINADMLIGVDFFLSHRLYVATSQRKLYFTYNGGPVFRPTNATNAPPLDAGTAPSLPQGPEPPAPPALQQAPASPASPSVTEAPGDAAGFSRRGAAYAARRDFAHAIDDLTRACELAPGEASYRYQRGLVRWQLRQYDLALADIDATLTLTPQDAEARVSRATLRLRTKDIAGAVSDLDAADQAAPKEANLRLQMARLYEATGHLDPALKEFNDWIGAHGKDVRRALALNGRCWVLALLNRQLDQALADCNAAVSLEPKAPRAIDSRALVYLRLGKLDKSIRDYDAALALDPKSAWSLYGRGIDRLREGRSTEGEADIAAASALRPGIAEEAAKFGITP